MNKKFIQIFLPVSVLVAVLILGFCFRKPVLALFKPLPPAERANAMLKLASQQKPEGKEKALKALAEKNDRSVTIAAIRTLGVYDDAESLAALSKVMDGNDEQLRMIAMQSLSSKRSPARETLLTQYIQQHANLRPNERLAGLMALFMLSADPKKRDLSIDEVLKLLPSLKNSPAYSQALGNLMTMAPKDERVLAISKAVLLNDKSEKHEIMMALIHFTRTTEHRAWVAPHLGRFLTHPDRDVRGIAVRSISLVCPANYYSVIDQRFKVEKDKMIRDRLNQLALRFPTKEMQNILRAELARVSDPGESAVLKSTISQIETHPGADPCKPSKTQQKK